MSYLDAFEYYYYDVINNVIDTCVEFHNATNSNNYVDKNIYSYN